MVAGSVYLGWTGFQDLDADLKHVQSMAASVDWPTTEGVIVESKLDSWKEKDGDSTYSLSVAYEYDVNGEKHRSDRISNETILDKYMSDGTEANNRAAVYKVGSKHKVFYQPDDPATAVMVPGVDPAEVTVKSFINVLFSVMLFLFAIIFGVGFGVGRDVYSRRRRFVVIGLSILTASVCLIVGALFQRDLVCSKIPAKSIVEIGTDGYWIADKKYDF
ncbi:MAG: DUF3592 domain-containing protein [Cyanobacteria bacterium HKST-UBA02]|nr:DUF3592 domain-containing protein [Cyanobacteria bacterium HKST-UBA02]